MKFELKKKLLVAALVPAIGLPLAATSFAQSADTQRPKTGQEQQRPQAQERQQGQQQRQNQQVRDMRASDIIGATVRDKQGERLGDVQDLIVDVSDERVNYAILAFGGFLGFGEKLFAYPMDRFQASGDDGKELTLSVSEQELKNAPGFDRSNWPTFGAAGGYRGEVDKHFGQTVKTGGNLVRMSELLNQDIQDRAGNEVGQIEDIVVSVTDGQVRYLVMEPDNSLNMGDRLVMLPMNAIQASAEQPQQQAQQGQQPGQPQDRTVASGDSGRSATGGMAQQRQSGQDREQAQQDRQQAQQERQEQRAEQRERQQDRDLQLVLNVEPQQLRNARSFESNQWPDLNSPSFQREMDNYSASFPSGRGQQATGASQDQSSAAGQEPTSGAGGASQSQSGSAGQGGSPGTGSSPQQERSDGASGQKKAD